MQKNITTSVATFGAAVGALGVASELQADIVDLTFNPGSVAFDTVGSVITSVDINELPGSVDFGQWNDALGKTLIFASGTISQWGFVSSNATIAPGTFAGGSFNLAVSAAASGTGYLGFRTIAGNVGWFSVDFGGAGNAITYTGGQYGTMGETLTIPAPAALSVLALGAAGIGRNRKRVA